MSVRGASRSSIRLSQARQLIGPVGRTLPWGPLAAASALAAFVVWGGTHHQPRQSHLPFAAVFISMAVGFVLADPSERIVGHVAMSLLTRRLVRVSLLVPAVAAAWAVLLLIASPGTAALGLTIDLWAWFATALAAAAVAEIFVHDGLSGVAAAGSLIALLAGMTALPERWRLWPLRLGQGDGLAAYGRPALASLVVLVVFAIASTDPARPRPWRLRRTARHGVRPPARLVRSAFGRDNVGPSR